MKELENELLLTLFPMTQKNEKQYLITDNKSPCDTREKKNIILHVPGKTFS